MTHVLRHEFKWRTINIKRHIWDSKYKTYVCINNRMNFNFVHVNRKPFENWFSHVYLSLTCCYSCKSSKVLLAAANNSYTSHAWGKVADYFSRYEQRNYKDSVVHSLNTTWCIVVTYFCGRRYVSGRLHFVNEYHIGGAKGLILVAFTKCVSCRFIFSAL